jgi:hypothetical protein
MTAEDRILELEAENAELRGRLQKAHGALFVLGMSDPQAGLRDLYDVSQLLEETTPPAKAGLELIARLRECEDEVRRLRALIDNPKT